MIQTAIVGHKTIKDLPTKVRTKPGFVLKHNLLSLSFFKTNEREKKPSVKERLSQEALMGKSGFTHARTHILFYYAILIHLLCLAKLRNKENLCSR